MLRTYKGKRVYSEKKKIRFTTDLRLIECLKPIKEEKMYSLCAHLFLSYHLT